MRAFTSSISFASVTRIAAAAAAAAAATAGALALGGTPAYASGAWVEVNPNTIQAGHRVDIRASCGDDFKGSAVVSSKAFGEVLLDHEWGFFVGSADVPRDTRPDSYAVRLRCERGARAETTLNVVGMDRPTQGPHTGGGGLAGSDDDGAARLVLAGGVTTVAIGAGLGMAAVRRRRVA